MAHEKPIMPFNVCLCRMHTLLSTSILTRLFDMILVFRGRQVWLVAGGARWCLVCFRWSG